MTFCAFYHQATSNLMSSTIVETTSHLNLICLYFKPELAAALKRCEPWNILSPDHMKGRTASRKFRSIQARMSLSVSRLWTTFIIFYNILYIIIYTYLYNSLQCFAKLPSLDFKGTQLETSTTLRAVSPSSATLQQALKDPKRASKASSPAPPASNVQDDFCVSRETNEGLLENKQNKWGLSGSEQASAGDRSNELVIFICVALRGTFFLTGGIISLAAEKVCPVRTSLRRQRQTWKNSIGFFPALVLWSSWIFFDFLDVLCNVKFLLFSALKPEVQWTWVYCEYFQHSMTD